ncbi:MAG TPA: L,D-transpeptidase family protein [Steroidobacteraceae bacterium]|nr:L,D-transpeptidase family protein [Steroidobacteraceae bacterium]
MLTIGSLGVGLCGPSQAASIRLHSPASERQRADSLYAARNGAPLWLRAGGRLGSQGRTLLQVLHDAGDYGLVPEDYQVDALQRALAALQAPRPSAAGEPDRAAARLGWLGWDRQLSASLLAFIDDLHAGRIDPRAAGFELPARSDGFDAAAALERLSSATDPKEMLAGFEPAFIHYRLLEAALPRYRALARQPQLTDLPALPGHPIRPGAGYAGAPQLRRLLRALGCLPASMAAFAQPGAAPADPSAAATRLDGALVAALRQFQWLHGLQVDGVLGARTYAALTVPLGERVRQMELTLERWRWLPPQRHPTIMVNIPEFRLFAFDGDSDREQGMLRMDVIVGQEYARTRTPVFMADMRTVVFRPYWDIPRSIVQREVLPALARDPDYLQRQHMQLVSGPSDESPVVAATPQNLRLLASGALRLRQQPGADNALGLIKFVLPNAHDVYLHSTPAVQLFGRAQRAFSHGCIRVSDAVALAQYALQGTPGNWTRANILAAMNGTRTLRVTLAQPVHVLILYGTAIASEDGQLHFFEDLYGQDRLLQALLGLPPLPRMVSPAQPPSSAAAPLPEAHAAGIHVHEIGGRVEADTAARQRARQHV